MFKCPNCGRENAPNFNFCLDCGYDIKAYREAFPDGPPTVPPPPTPAITNTQMPMSSQLPHAMTPQASMSPLPPRPADIGQASFPPLPVDAPPPPPTNLPIALTPGPMAAPVAPITIPPVPPPLSQNTGSLTAASMPPLDLPIPSSPPTEPETPPPAPPVPVSAPPVSIPVPPVSAPPVVSAPPAQAQSATTRQCPSCGYDNALAVKFCGNCGKRVDGAPLPPPEPEAQGRTMFMHAADPLPGVNEKQCKLVAIDQQGREGMNFSIKKGETLCGRHTGAILFVDDPFVSPTHCKFVFSGDKLVVHDAQSLNGVYLRVKQERRLQDGELIRLGRQLFRFEQLKNAAFQVKKAASDDSRIWGSPTTTSFGRIVQILDDGRTGEIRLLAGERVQIGREIGDVVIPTDGFISGRHCVFMLHNGEPVLSDLGSSNGTYVRVRDQAELAHGDFVLVGNQMLRVEIV